MLRGTVLLLLQPVQKESEDEENAAAPELITHHSARLIIIHSVCVGDTRHNMSNWEEHFCADEAKDERTRGKAYYANKETKETRWDEPESFRTFRLDVDAGIFTEIGRDAIGEVVKPLRFLMRCESARDAKAWMNARDVLYKILKNISEHPNEGKYRRLNKKAGGSFVEKVWSVRFARECLVACGFTETADAVELILDTQRPEMNAKTLTKCRVLLSRLEPAIKARDAHVRLAREDDSSSGVNRRHLAPNKKCSHCSNEIESGARRLWTTDPFAPKGQYSFKCSQCVDKDYILCETCWDKKIENREPIHVEHARFEHVPPIESRHNTSTRGFGRGPWGNFAASSVGNARERLRQRTGL